MPPAVPRLFLGRLDEASLRTELEQAGILSALRERGFAELNLFTEYQARSIYLDSRGIVEALRNVYGARTLADELTGATSAQ